MVPQMFLLAHCKIRVENDFATAFRPFLGYSAIAAEQVKSNELQINRQRLKEIVE